MNTPSWEMLTGGDSPSGVDIWNRREGKDKMKVGKESLTHAQKDRIQYQEKPPGAILSQVPASISDSTPVRMPASAAHSRHRNTDPRNTLTTIPSGDATPIAGISEAPKRYILVIGPISMLVLMATRVSH